MTNWLRALDSVRTFYLNRLTEPILVEDVDRRLIKSFIKRSELLQIRRSAVAELN